ncbi:hypothetical protein [Microcoleus sp. FACHB-672]|nr:hypothetical protein [Microcoleus sp. FACHB-672]
MASGIETTFPMMPVFQPQYADIKTWIVAKISSANINEFTQFLAP